MGITIFKIFIWGGISLDIRSEITFYGSASRRHKIKFPTSPNDDEVSFLENLDFSNAPIDHEQQIA